MGVYIKGIDIPEINRGVAAIINIDDILFFKTADDIVLVPDHGDLVDRDGLIEEAKMLGAVTCNQPFDFPYGCNLVEWCKAAETVIPAERKD